MRTARLFLSEENNGRRSAEFVVGEKEDVCTLLLQLATAQLLLGRVVSGRVLYPNIFSYPITIKYVLSLHPSDKNSITILKKYTVMKNMINYIFNFPKFVKFGLYN